MDKKCAFMNLGASLIDVGGFLMDKKGKGPFPIGPNFFRFFFSFFCIFESFSFCFDFGFPMNEDQINLSLSGGVRLVASNLKEAKNAVGLRNAGNTCYLNSVIQVTIV